MRKRWEVAWAIAEKTICDRAAVKAPPYNVPIGTSPWMLCWRLPSWECNNSVWACIPSPSRTSPVIAERSSIPCTNGSWLTCIRYSTSLALFSDRATCKNAAVTGVTGVMSPSLWVQEYPSCTSFSPSSKAAIAWSTFLSASRTSRTSGRECACLSCSEGSGSSPP